MYLLMSKGAVQYHAKKDGSEKGILVATHRNIGNKAAKWFSKTYSKKITLGEIGTVQGETLELHIEAARREGAVYLYEIIATEEDGTPKMRRKTL